jgi:hypothetical protein
MLYSLACQLAQECPTFPESLEKLYEWCGKGGSKPSHDSILNTLKDIVSKVTHTYIILDALDECANREELLETLEQIKSWKLASLHILVTSRPEREIKTSIQSYVASSDIIELEVGEVDEDIKIYIQQRLMNDKKLQKWYKNDKLRHDIEMTLSQKAKGM